MAKAVGPVIDRVLAGTMTLVAIVAVAVYLQRVSVAGDRRSPAQQELSATRISHVEQIQKQGLLVGPEDARMRITIFNDYQCPACRVFYMVLFEFLSRHAKDVAVIYLHYPLASHRFAASAARAADCSEASGRFSDYHHLLFEFQHEIGVKSWSEFARQAQIQDVGSFDRCMLNESDTSRLAVTRSLAQSVQLRGTPTVLINEWRLSRQPNVSELEAALEAVSAGEDILRAMVRSNGQSRDRE